MALAAYVVEALSGENFTDYAQRNILGPLHMTSSTFEQPPPAGVAERSARMAGAVTAPFLDPYPAGSLVAAPIDMARFVASQLGSPLDGSAPILPDASRINMLNQHFTPHPGMPGAAYGYFQSEANGHPSLHHTGDGGDHSLIYLVPDAKLGFYLVYTAPKNADSSTPREQIAHDLIDHYLGCAQPFRQPAAPTGFAQRADRYAGTYRINTYAHDTIEKLAALQQEITVTNPGDGSLSVVLGGGRPIRLVESSANLFRDPDGAYVAFHPDAAGRITALSFNGAAVDDPGSAHRLRWWETAQANLTFILLVPILTLASSRLRSGCPMVAEAGREASNGYSRLAHLGMDRNRARGGRPPGGGVGPDSWWSPHGRSPRHQGGTHSDQSERNPRRGVGTHHGERPHAPPRHPVATTPSRRQHSHSDSRRSLPRLLEPSRSSLLSAQPQRPRNNRSAPERPRQELRCLPRWHRLYPPVDAVSHHD